MNTDLYKGVRMVLGDQDQGFTRDLSAAFFPFGLRDIAVCVDRDQIIRAVGEMVDVLVCDVHQPGVEFHALAQDIRHGRLGDNPFIVLIATALIAEEENLSRILESGVDDVVLKPLDTQNFVRRIGGFARKRKPFVVTPMYVGPSRRNGQRGDGSDETVVEVPNTFRAKVVQRQKEAEIHGQLQSGRSMLDEGRLTSGMKVIARLTRRLLDLEDNYAFAEESKRLLRTLAQKASEVEMEHRNSATTGHVALIAERIGRLSFRAESAITKPAGIEFKLLSQLSDAAMVAFTTAQRSHGTVPAIVDVVDGYLRRA